MSRRFPVFVVLALTLVYLFSGQLIVGPVASRAQAKARARAEPDQQSTQTPTPLPCVDQYEPDDTPAEAKTMPYPGDQWHSICPAGDVDYVRFVAHQGLYYDIGVWGLQADVTMRVQLYGPDGSTELSSGEGRNPYVAWWHCTSDGPYFVKVSAVDPLPEAPGHTYRLAIIVVGHDTPTALPPTPVPPRYVPLNLNRWPLALDALSPAATAEPTSAPAATSTATASPTSTVTTSQTPTPTEPPSRVKVNGYVREGSGSGPGLSDVSISFCVQLNCDAYHTDTQGYYETRVYELHSETCSVTPWKPGYSFEPPGFSWWHYGHPGDDFQSVSFVAVTVTPPATPPTPTPTPIPPNSSVADLAIDPSSGALWIGTYGQGAVRLDIDEQRLVLRAADGLASDTVVDIVPDPATDDVWFGTWGGVSRLRPNGVWQTFREADGLAGDRVDAVAVDAVSGDRWFGTFYGLTRLDSGGRWETFTEADGLPGAQITALAIDTATGIRWIGTANGLARLDADGRWRTYEIDNDFVTAVAVDPASRDVWIGGYCRGYARIGADGRLGPLTVHALPNPCVHDIAIDQITGDTWIATTRGVVRRGTDGRWTTYTTLDGLASNDVSAIAIDAKTGARWFGTKTGGLSRLDAAGVWSTYPLPMRVAQH